jgi:4-amino-4-deoxy-L-arabinose transferase-like glycosyltransferase
MRKWVTTRAPRQTAIELAIVLTLVVVALSVRLYRLHEIPFGLNYDEAANGIDVGDILAGQRPIFFERNHGREPLFIYLQAMVAAVVGTTPFALRLTAALIGAATVPAVYWMVREAFHGASRWPALWTALFLAFSYWHLNISRIGYRAIMLPLMAALAFAWFWRAWRALDDGKRFPWADLMLCGVFTGASLYTYTAARFLPVLVVVVAFAGGVISNRSTQRFRRIVAAVAIIGLVTAVVAAPLAVYFLTHPESFTENVGGVSLFRSTTGPMQALLALAGNLAKTAAMFGVAGDAQGRLNPAGQSPFNLLIGIWLVAGVVLALVRWRSLPDLFGLLWLAVMSLPAVLSTPTPHSLRALAMLPAAYLLSTLAMLAAGGRLSRVWKPLAVWLPLPFLILSSGANLRSYFSSWQYNPLLESAYHLRFAESAQALQQQSMPGNVWLMPYWPIYATPDANYVFDFLTQGNLPYGLVAATEEEAPSQLGRATSGYSTGNLVRWNRAALEPDGSYAMVDWKDLVRFLLLKHGGQAIGEGNNDYSQYTRYRLPAGAEYEIASEIESQDIAFGNAVKLTGLAYGHVAADPQETAAALEDKSLPSGQPAWVVLRWQSLQAVDNDQLKVSLFLTDEAGHLAGQVDDRLLGDFYLFEPTWKADQAASSYHILPSLPAIPSGRYDLNLAVYDSTSLRRYPVVDPITGQTSSVARLGSIEVTRPLFAPEVSPQADVSSTSFPDIPLSLLGFDLPSTVVNPGDILPLTLYWQAKVQPPIDYLVSVELQSESGQPVLQRQAPLAGDRAPTSSWQAGDVVRGWHDIVIPPTTPAGIYRLVIRLGDDGHFSNPLVLEQVEVGGRPHIFSPPSELQPMPHTFGDAIAFLGYSLPTDPPQPGQPLRLTLFWQALGEIDQSYAVFIHILNAAGQIVAQQDVAPGQGTMPTQSWVRNEYITDTHQIELPSDLPPGQYQVVIGMYEADTGIRLPVANAHAQLQGDRIILPEPMLIAP